MQFSISKYFLNDRIIFFKLFQNGEHVAMLVAGWSKEDTRRATRVVSEYQNWADKLVGMEVVVTGTSLSDIDVSAPAPMAPASTTTATV